MGSVTISVRIPKELKDKVDRYGVRISEVVRKRELEEAAKVAEELGELFSRVPDDEIVRAIKEDRRGR